MAPLVMSTPLPRLAEIRLPWGGRTITPAVGSLPPVAWPPIMFATASFVTRIPFFAFPRRNRAGHIGADVIHRDRVAAAAVDSDAVAAIAADDIGELEAEVDRRLISQNARARIGNPNDLIARDRIAGERRVDIGIAQIRPHRRAERTVWIKPDASRRPLSRPSLILVPSHWRTAYRRPPGYC